MSRDGQKRPVFIYRFLTAGAIDGIYLVPCFRLASLTVF